MMFTQSSGLDSAMASSVLPCVPDFAANFSPDFQAAQFLPSLVDLMPVAAVVQDLWTGHCVLWNQAAERRFGYSAQSAIGQPLDQLLPLDSAVWGQCDRVTLPSTLSPTQPDTGSEEIARYLLLTWAQDRAIAQSAQSVEVQSHLPGNDAAHDAALIATQQELEQLRSELQQAQEVLSRQEQQVALSQKMMEVAHEISNPVNFLCGNLRYVTDYSQQLLQWVQFYHGQAESHPDIQITNEAIDLEFLQEDFPKVLNSMWAGSERLLQILQILKPPI
ncbi:MAG: PAS domain-containing protein [Synechococcales bacterium]|nr:PAS domain-containing protein [Synechococcales bacterium]